MMERWLLEEFDVKLVEPEGLQLGSFYVLSTELIICMSYRDSNIATRRFRLYCLSERIPASLHCASRCMLSGHYYRIGILLQLIE